jgi:hypothetical protein
MKHLCPVCYLILTAPFGGQVCCYHSHITDGPTEQKVKELARVLWESSDPPVYSHDFPTCYYHSALLNGTKNVREKIQQSFSGFLPCPYSKK